MNIIFFRCRVPKLQFVKTIMAPGIAVSVNMGRVRSYYKVTDFKKDMWIYDYKAINIYVKKNEKH